MRIFIAADIEGCTGVVHHDQLFEGRPRYQEARRLMTEDINAAIKGALQQDPDALFVVGDGHAEMRNVILEDLHPSAELVVGSAHPDNKPLCQCEGIDNSHDITFLVGFHSRAGTTNGLLSHTLIGGEIYRFKINDEVVGEAAIAEAICASFAAPVGLIVGNSELEAECAQTLAGGYEFVSTKRTLGRTAAICRSPSATRPDISNAAARAVEKFRAGELKHRQFSEGICMQVEFFKPESALRAARFDGIELTEERTISVTSTDGADCFRQVWRAVCYAQADTPQWLS